MKHVLVQRCPDGYRTALTENGKLIEYVVDRRDSSIVGNVYKGIIKKINTGFIFLDIGLTQQAFLDTRDSREKGLLNGSKLIVKQGDELIVQILKDPLGDKGPVATSNIAYTGRFAVVSKSVDGDKITLSRKIDRANGERLLQQLGDAIPSGFLVILRTAAAERTVAEITNEITQLVSQFDKHAEWSCARPPAVLREEPPILRTLRDLTTDDIDATITDCRELIAQNPHLQLQYYDSAQYNAQPIFEHYFLQTQIAKLRDKRVWLNSGAFIVIEQVEACVVIDVNTGKSSGRNNNTDAAKIKVNMEAAKEIARQLRLRNLSGIIIIDFIAMKSQDDIDALTDFLRHEFRKDRIPTVAVGMTTLGLMEVTRKRTRNVINAH